MSQREEAKRESFLIYFWVASGKDEFDLCLPFQTIAELSHAVAVLNEIGR